MMLISTRHTCSVMDGGNLDARVGLIVEHKELPVLPANGQDLTSRMPCQGGHLKHQKYLDFCMELEENCAAIFVIFVRKRNLNGCYDVRQN